MKLPDRLPSLEGRRAGAVRIAFMIAAVLMTAITLGNAGCYITAYFRIIPSAARYGLHLVDGAAGAPIISDVQGAAKAAGIAPGSRVVGLGGRALPDNATLLDAGKTIMRTNGALSIDTIDDRRAVSHHVLSLSEPVDNLLDSSAGIPMNVYGAVQVVQPLVLSLLLIAISLLLARKRPRDPEAMLLSFGFLLLAFGLNNDLWFWQLHPPLSPAAGRWIENVLAVLGFWAMFVGFCAFPDGRFATRWSRIAWMVPTAYVLLNAATNFTLWTSQLATIGLDVPIYVAVTTSVLLRYRTAPPGLQRQQVKWALFGGAIMILAAFIGFIAQVPLITAALGPVPTFVLRQFHDSLNCIAFPLGLLVSLLRYRLYDADTVITRSTVYAVLAVVLVAVFACTEKIIELLGEEYFGQNLGVLAGGLGAGIAAVLLGPLHHRISRWVDHQFRHDLLQLKTVVPAMMNDLADHATPTDLARAVLDRIARTLHAVSGAVLGADGRVFAAQDVTEAETQALPMRVPLATHRGAGGWLLLGPRPDGSLYGRDERDTLTEISGAIAQGLAAATRHEAIAADHARERAALHERLGALEQAVERLSKAP
ncbi:MAG TPA: hypothetical protein VG407_13000 [Caulobacteraceae bacterium]|jgi:hypothetical protein|nr:hypothetical protein [Caulobacteraceae bacterium]